MDPCTHGKAPPKRGKACYPCTTVRTKCDGVQPFCGPCVRAKWEDDCEYIIHRQKARVQTFRERIQELEVKIRVFEQGKGQASKKKIKKSREATPSTSTSVSSQNSRSIFPFPSTGSSGSSIRSTPAPPSSTCSSSPRTQESTELFVPESFAKAIPLNVARLFWDTFFAHAADFCFFLDLALIEFRPVADRPAHISPGLTATIYLLSVHVLAHPGVAKLESFLLATACNLLLKELAIPGANIAEILQAELLLAQYFFARGRNTQARFHMSIGLGIAFGCGLPDKACPGLDPRRSRTAYLFLLSLDNAWSAALGYTPHKSLSSVSHGSKSEVLNDLWMVSGFPGDAIVVTKSVTLWQSVEELLTTPVPSGDLFERSENLEKLIQLWLLELDNYESGNRDGGALSRVLLLAGTITHYAYMKLRRLAWVRETREDHLRSACAILYKTITAVEKGRITYLNPLMGKIWYGVYELLSDEICQRGVLGEDTSGLKLTLRAGLDAISTLSSTCCFAREFSVLDVPS